VLAIDQIADRSGQAKPAKAVTIEVTTEDAQKVALGASIGQLSLVLRQAGSAYIGDFRRINIEDLGRPLNDTDAPKASPDRTLVTVTRGVSERSIYEISDSGRREYKLTGPAQGPTQAAAPPHDTAQLIAHPE
jgi:Flp pilus assembly protein CpaB